MPLRDAVERALRGRKTGWAVLGLHLSRLVPPAPQPHHQRIARAVLGDAAARFRGQLFTLINGDLALLFAPGDNGVSLAATLGALFSADAPDPSLILSRWPLPARLKDFYAFLDALPTMVAAPAKAEQEIGLAAVTKLFNAVDLRRVRELLERQTGVLVAIAGSERVVPLFREIRFSLLALEARAAASGHVTADPFMFRHLTAKLDGALLSAMVADFEHDRPMVAGVQSGKLSLHVNISVEAVLSAPFALLVDVAARAGARVAIEIAMLEAFADTETFVRARARVEQAGFSLVLDDVTHHALLVTKTTAFGFDLLKLDWSRQLLQAGDTIDAALKEIGPAKIILQKADTEDAVRWGLARGIRRFQGRHTDAMLAAGRLAVCPAAGECTLRKCIERERSATPLGRTGCLNHPLLDASVAGAEQIA